MPKHVNEFTYLAKYQVHAVQMLYEELNLLPAQQQTGGVSPVTTAYIYMYIWVLILKLSPGWTSVLSWRRVFILAIIYTYLHTANAW